jgi:signal transduction histidine kinase
VVEDRQRIARDLHDSVIQDLFAVGLSLQGLSLRLTDDETGGLLTESIDTLDDSVNTLRRYVFELKDASQPAVGLDERLQVMVARMGSAYPVRVRLTLDYTESGELDDDIVLLATEALSNALRHSQAQSVELTLTRDDESVILRVIDDGVGFEASESVHGMGLANMTARAKTLGGSVEVRSSESGTVVEARLPVRRAVSPG